MTVISAISGHGSDPYEQLVRELRTQYRCVDVDALADRIVAAEAADFHWDARVRERYLGHCSGADLEHGEGGEEFVRVAIVSFLGGRWHAGTCTVDGEGRVARLLRIEACVTRDRAEAAFMRTH